MASVKRYDRGTLRPARRMADGRVRVDARIARAGVQTYYDENGNPRRELRHPDDVGDRASLDSFAMVPVTNDHPDAGLVTSKNAKVYAVGTTDSKVTFDGQHVDTELVVYDDATIGAMDRGKVELSGGYTCDLEMKPGVDPVYGPYDARQRNIRGNHVAIVDRGRAGPTVRARMDGMEVVVDDLSAAQRHAMPGHMFAVPGREDLPIEDPDHVRAAMARFNQEHFQPGEKRAAFHAIVARAKHFGIDATGFVAKYGGTLDAAQSPDLRARTGVQSSVGMDPADALRTVTAQLTDAEKKIGELESRATTETTRADVAEGELKVAKEKIATLQAQVSSQQAAVDTEALRKEKERADGLAAKVERFDASFKKAVAERAALVHEASLVLGGSFRMDDLDDRTIRCEVLKRLDANADVTSAVADGVIVGMYNARIADHKRNARQAGELGITIADAIETTRRDEETREDEISRKRKEDRDRWKHPLPNSREAQRPR